MRLLTLVLLILVVVAGCGPGNQKEVQPNATTNEVALTNLKLGIEYMRRGDYESAVDKLDRARSADPGYYATYNAYGLLYQALKRPQQARDSFKKALQLNPGDSPTMNNYGRFLCESKELDKAEQMFNKAAANPLYETPEIPITNAGTCDMLNGRRKQAEKYFRKALEINPTVPTALLQMAHLTYDDGNYMSARGYYQRFLGVAPQNPDSLWLGVRIESKLGDKDAVSSYALLLRNNFPDSEEAKLLQDSGIR